MCFVFPIQIMDSIILGIVSGLLTSFVVICLQGVWRNTLLPLYEECVYKDLKIEGLWVIKYPGTEMEEQVELKRRAHFVSGKIVSLKGADAGKEYTFEGIFKNLIVTGSYSSSSRAGLDRGVFSLMVKNNGIGLEGHGLVYNDETHSVDAVKCEWFKKS